MSEENLRVVRAAYEAWNEGGRESLLQGVLAFADPDIVWVTPKEDPDWDTYRGIDAMIRFWTQWSEAVGDLSFEPREFRDSADKVWLDTIRRARGRASGIDVEDRIFHVITMRDGKATRVEEFFDRDESLEAAGLDK